MSNLKARYTETFSEGFNQPFGGQRADCLAITYGATIRTTKGKPHLDIVCRWVAVRRPIHVEVGVGASLAIAEVMPDFADIILMLDSRCVVDSFPSLGVLVGLGLLSLY